MRTERARLVFWLQAASLAATAWFVWKYSVRAQLHFSSLAMLTARSVLVALTAALWAAVITIVLLLAVARMERDRAWRVTLRTAASAIWFAPATMLLTAASPVYLAASLALTISATRLLYSQWRAASPALPEAEPYGAAGVLRTGGIETGFLPRNPGIALAAGLSAQTAIAAWVMGASALAAGLFSLLVAILTIFATSAGVVKEEQPTLPESALGFVLTVLLAVGMMVTGLGGRRSGAGGDGGAQMAKTAAPKEAAPPVNYRLAASGDFPGVILRPEQRSVPLLVEPVPSHGKFAQRSPDRPFSIPFDGEYWLYRWPFQKPPAGSYLYHGSPTTTSYRTTDNTPLRMDAHQLLEREIDLTCCSRIEIEILNADTHPNSVVMELMVADRGGRPVSLGTQLVRSRPDESAKPVRAVYETLGFGTVPMNIDEVKVQFHRMLGRADRSARIAINRFLLIPR